MAYKRQSPMPITEGGTNASSYATVDGTTYYDGTRLVVTATGTTGQVLTSNGSGSAPSYQNFGSRGGASILSTTAHSSTPIGQRFVLCSTAAINWIAIGGVDITTVQAAAQMVIPATGTLKNLYVIVSANASTSNVTCTLNVNGVNSALVVTIPSATTGTFSDTTHSVSVSAGDLIQWEMSRSTLSTVSGSITMIFQG